MKLDAAAPFNPALISLSQKPTIEKGKLDMARIDETAKDFEAMFMSEMLKPMFEGLEVDANFGGGKGEEIFRSFMLDEYGKSMATQGSLGIADLVKQQLIEMQSKPQTLGMAQDMHNSTEDNAGESTDV